MKVLEVNVKMVVRIPDKTDLSDVCVDFDGDPNVVVSHGGIYKIKSSVPSWAITRVKKTILPDL